MQANLALEITYHQYSYALFMKLSGLRVCLPLRDGFVGSSAEICVQVMHHSLGACGTGTINSNTCLFGIESGPSIA